jgi:uncharacterized OB-fold protein
MTIEPTKTTEKSIWMPYTWSTGPGIGTFLTGLREGEIVAAVCPDCGDRILPARSFCKACQTEIEEYEPVGETGTLETVTVVHDDRETAPFEPPYALGTIALEGADTAMLHVIDGDEATLAALEPGTTVEAVWRPADEREGSILDIAHFQPEGQQ